jgi:hypothetical protein
MFNTSLNPKSAIHTASKKNEASSIPMSQVTSIKNNIIGRFGVRRLAFFGGAALALSAVLASSSSTFVETLSPLAVLEDTNAVVRPIGGSLASQTATLEMSSDWRAHDEQDRAMGAAAPHASRSVISPEWTVLLEKDAYESRAAGAHVSAEPFKLSPEWTVLVEKDSYESRPAGSYAAAEARALSPEWTAFLETERLLGGVDPSYHVIGQ